MPAYGAFQDQQVHNFLNAMFGGTPFPAAPGTYYLGLSTFDAPPWGPSPVEPSAGAGYARLSIVNDATNFPAATARSKWNGAAFTYAAATGSWGTIKSWFLSKDATGSGKIVASGQLDVPAAIAAGEVWRFAAGALRFEF